MSASVRVPDLAVHGLHALFHPLERGRLLAQLGLNVVVDLHQDAVLVVHVAERLAQHLQPLLGRLLALLPPLLEVGVAGPLAALQHRLLQAAQPAREKLTFYSIMEQFKGTLA